MSQGEDIRAHTVQFIGTDEREDIDTMSRRQRRIRFTTEEVSAALVALAYYRKEFGAISGTPEAVAAVEKVASVVQETDRGSLYLGPFEIV